MNQGIRTMPGEDGDVIVAAYCPTCAVEAMPSVSGVCFWCNTRILDVVPEEDLKECAKCGLAQERSEFYRHRETKDKLSAWCKSCFREHQLARYHRTKQRRAAAA